MSTKKSESARKGWEARRERSRAKVQPEPGVVVKLYEIRLVEVGVLRVAETTVCNPIEAERIAHARLADSPVERLIAILLSAQNQVLGVVDLATTGSISTCHVNPTLPFKVALAANASAVLLAHNHPSGDPTPSEDDRKLTSSLVAAGEFLKIPIIDHIIVTRDGPYFSFREMGQLEGKL